MNKSGKLKTYGQKIVQLSAIFLAKTAIATSHQTITGSNPKGVTFASPVGNIVSIINNFTGFFIGLSSFIAVGIVIYAGYLYMFSGGDPSKVQTAHKALLYTAIGYGIILLTWGGLIPLFKQIGGF